MSKRNKHARFRDMAIVVGKDPVSTEQGQDVVRALEKQSLGYGG